MNVVVVIGGGPLGPEVATLAPPGALVIAADSGVDHARAGGLDPDVVVGDFDSISDAGAAWVAAHEVTVERHPPNKDATDTELAVAHAATLTNGELLVVGGGPSPTMPEPRLDHLLATIGCLGSSLTEGFSRVTARLGSTTVLVATPSRPLTIDLAAGTVFSVLALHGACHGVSIEGAEWPLNDADLTAGSGHGVSNIARQLVSISVAIKAIGLFTIPVVLHPEVKVNVTINVARSEDEAERQARGEDVLAGRTEAEEAKVAAEELFEEGAGPKPEATEEAEA